AARTESSWFSGMRSEMLKRKIPSQFDEIVGAQDRKAKYTLAPFLPPEAVKGSDFHRRIGHHLFYFNSHLPTNVLLPDGTDSLHSPGEPFERRMWAGGSVRINLEEYDKENVGWHKKHQLVCLERVKDVQIRGTDEAAKIFVTIERKIARKGLSRNLEYPVVDAGLIEDTKDSLETEKFLVVEDRNLVFMRARSLEEREAIQAGQLTPVKYLKPPGEPDFSHTLTPTSALLFRFSALTFNAHLIHLDPGYARNIEGHRGLLVHGPLSLSLLLNFLSHQLNLLDTPQRVFSIDYRNLAPLYCDEPMRLCARKRPAQNDADDYVLDVWIEGPSGGMAVKGTV
ncbi:hypothetical protein BU24DRAFT_315126, partial [Aaosphaeria arxii CBS 175.79]